VASTSRIEQSDEDAILPVSLGTIVWCLVLVVLLFQRSTLEANGTSWWIGVAVVGIVSGIGGVLFLTWRKGRRNRRTPSTESTP
jgi:protein-S-isoprenylcysteine O-methyltransferase Ste14